MSLEAYNLQTQADCWLSQLTGTPDLVTSRNWNLVEREKKKQKIWKMGTWNLWNVENEVKMMEYVA